jgi:hypothetical protein
MADYTAEPAVKSLQTSVRSEAGNLDRLRLPALFAKYFGPAVGTYQIISTLH